MCKFMIERYSYPNGEEYIVKVRIGDSYHNFSFEGFLDEKRIEITFPSKEELGTLLEPECIEQLKEELWHTVSFDLLLKG